MFDYLINDLKDSLKQKITIILFLITFLIIYISYLYWVYYKTDEQKSVNDHYYII
jgi:hypothetical protein